MAKEHYVELAGKKRLIRYTRQERVEIEERFDCDIKTFVYEKAFPMVDGKATGGGILVCQEALIYYGLRHNGPKVTEDQVSKWLEAEVEAGRTVIAPLVQCIVGLLASGILGWTPPLADDEPDEGKAEAVSEPEDVPERLARVGEITPIKRTG